ncbi:hypothetical protein RS84_01058 [Microbacterium hydrocarbonoxydans]|uniref:Lipoprotein n=1 Tax=Microbacterium hydrocarbonoxydans TaxID=273678 RepID=A0A0M2HV17_9MICO|nr:hypothetical protein [Microbacterium hydrocarbonoxydans]KJL48299.1 hypothetical protein RS84_01058 [Microbacterium hydrocarbonoxydans]
MPASVNILRIGATIAGAVLLLSGCTAAPPADDPSPSASATTESASVEVAVNGPAITGTGTAMDPGVALAIPAGDFRSVTLTVDCAGDATFQVGISDPAGAGLSLQRGRCGGDATFEWPLTATTEKALSVAIREGVAWSVTPRFSTAEFVVDPEIAEDCAAFSGPYSAIFNADVGYAQYDDVDEAEWNERIDTAADTLADLADESSSRLAESFTALVPILRDPQRVPGDMMSAMRPQTETILDACGANQTQVSINADYGA